EITESSLLNDEKSVAKTLHALKDLGVSIALDDFGTGYSSYHFLQTFDLDTIKIDQMFIRNLYAENKTETKEDEILSCVLNISKELHMKVVVKGVEEYEQLEYLEQKECDLIQGYLFSKPLPVGEFEKKIKQKYFKPKKRKTYLRPEKERRKYFRFIFPNHLVAKMEITEVNNRKVNMGQATILAENVSVGGIRFLSTLEL